MSAPETVSRFPKAIQTVSFEAQGFRPFIVADGGYVELPGCLEIEELRLAGQVIPPYEEHKVPTDLTHQNFKIIQVPNYQLVDGPGGTVSVVRSLNSNDGVWQVGNLMHVKGTWSSDAKAKKAS